MDSQKTHITVFFFLLLFYTVTSLFQYVPYHFLRGDSSFYAQIDRSLVEHLTLRQEKVQPRSWYTRNMGWNYNYPDSWSDISLGSNGRWYPKHPFLMPLVAVPFFIAFGTLGLLLFSILVASLGMYFAFLASERLFGNRAALITLAVFIPFQIMVYNTYGFRNDIFYATLVSASLFYAIDERPAISGIMAGFALFAKVTNILILLPVLLPILILQGRRSILRFIAAASGPVFLLALANTVMYGAPWILSYQRVLVMHNGHTEVVQHSADFRFPFWAGIKRLIMNRSQGILYIAPASTIGVLGLFFLFRKARWLALGIFIAFLAFFLFHAKYIYLWGRFFLPWYEVSMVPAAAFVLAVDHGLDHVKIRGKRLAWAWGGLFVLLAFLGLVRWAWQSSFPADMYREVESLSVFLGDIPCDYFNMGDEKWECSHFDHGNRYFTGRALGNQCEFPGTGNRFIVIPTDHARVRKVRWVLSEAPGRKFRVIYGRERGSANQSVKLNILVDGSPLVGLVLGRSGILKKDQLVLPKNAKSLTITVQPSKRPIRACINIVPIP